MRLKTATGSPLPVVLRRAFWELLILAGVLGQRLIQAADDLGPVGPLWQLRISPDATTAARFLTADSATAIRLTGDAPLAAISRLDQAPRTQDLRPWLPLSLIRFRNGDRLMMSVVRLTPTQLHVVDGQMRSLTIPRAAVESIEQPAGVVTTQCRAVGDRDQQRQVEAETTQPIEDALGSVLQLSRDAALKLPLDEPLSVGQFVLWIKVAESPTSVIDVRFEFSDGQKIQASELKLGGWGSTPATQVAGSETAPAADWVCLRVLMTDEQFTIATDFNVVASGERAGRRLTAVRVSRAERAKDVGRALLPVVSKDGQECPPYIGPVFVQEFVTAQRASPPLASGRQDAVQLQSGDCLFGSIVACDQQHVVLKTQREDISLPSRDVVALRFGQRPLVAQPVSGWIVRIKLQGQRSNSSDATEDVLQGAIVAADSEGLEFEHSLVGRRRIEWARLRQIEPLFVGSSLLLETGPRHLGTRPRDDFQQAAPEGIRLAVTATIDAVPSGPCYLSLLASDLEPAGPETLRASPTLRDLGDGFFTTSVFVNGKLIGNLNDFTSQWSSKTTPVRIRLPLPSALLRRGANEIEFRQAASRADATSYDDCELRNIALECERP